MASERMQRRIERLLDQADEAADRREWAEVQRLAEDILLIDSANADAEASLIERRARRRFFFDLRVCRRGETDS